MLGDLPHLDGGRTILPGLGGERLGAHDVDALRPHHAAASTLAVTKGTVHD
jgi:hypothetical protein